MRALAIVLLLARSAGAEPDLGEPLPGPSARPALSWVTPYVMSLDVTSVGTVPAIRLDNGAMTPSGSAVLVGPGFRAYAGGSGLHRFWYYSMGGSIELGVGSNARLFTIELPSPGIGYRTRDWLFGAQLVPAIAWFVNSTGTGATYHGGSADYFSLAVDVQACRQYNLFGMFPKNSAACVFAAPAIYRDGWLPGATVGVRWFPL